MKKLELISESIKRKVVNNKVNEAHVETDKMMYANEIALEIQKQKTELNNLFQAEIMDSSSDYESGNGGGRIKVTKPAVPDELEYHVELENIKSPEPKIGEDGQEQPGDNVPEAIADVTISVCMNDGKMEQEKLKAQPIAGLKDAVVAFVMAKIMEHYQKQKVNEAVVNEDAANLQAVAAGVAAVMASGVGLAGLMEYLKKHYPKAYKTLSDLGSSAADSRVRGVNTSEAVNVNEDAANLQAVAAGIAAVMASGVGIAGLMEYLKKHYPKAYAVLSDLGSSASNSRSRGVNTAESIATSNKTKINEAKKFKPFTQAEKDSYIQKVLDSGLNKSGVRDELNVRKLALKNAQTEPKPNKEYIDRCKTEIECLNIAMEQMGKKK